jgi:hypothetical protein
MTGESKLRYPMCFREGQADKPPKYPKSRVIAVTDGGKLFEVCLDLLSEGFNVERLRACVERGQYLLNKKGRAKRYIRSDVDHSDAGEGRDRGRRSFH